MEKKCPVNGCVLKHLNMAEHFLWVKGEVGKRVVLDPDVFIINAPKPDPIPNVPNIVDSVPNESIPNVPNAIPNRTASERSREWKKTHRDRYNEFMRKYMQEHPQYRKGAVHG